MAENMKILLALDFTEDPAEILKKTSLIADTRNARIFLIHVMNDMPRISFYSDAYELWEEFRDQSVKKILEKMNEYVRNLSGTFKDVEPIVEVGEPAGKIVETADKLGVSLIVVGTHARTGISHLLHGNTGEKVFRMAGKPVLCFPVGTEAA